MATDALGTDLHTGNCTGDSDCDVAECHAVDGGAEVEFGCGEEVKVCFVKTDEDPFCEQDKSWGRVYPDMQPGTMCFEGRKVARCGNWSNVSEIHEDEAAMDGDGLEDVVCSCDVWHVQ